MNGAIRRRRRPPTDQPSNHVCASVIIMNRGTAEVLITRDAYNPDYGDPGTKIRPGELPRDAAERIIRDTLDMDADDVSFVGAVFNAWCKSVTHLYTTDGKVEVDAYNTTASWTHPRELPGKAGFRLQRSLALTAAMRDRIKKPAHDTPQMRAMFGLPPKPA
jgi:ADP-ribose pyrophosphatase YjhB (NUDIX family)